MSQVPQCVDCVVRRCGQTVKDAELPPGCPTLKYPGLLQESVERFKEPGNAAVMRGWLKLMGRINDPERPRERWSWTRVDEIIEYAKIRGMKRLGIATCYMLLYESKLLVEILEKNGMEVVSVTCLCGETNPHDLGLPGEIICNPILQAEVLERERTELNIMMGLCVGHDILFLRHSKTETTPLVVKDRAMGHNPIAALHLSRSFYRDRFSPVR